MEMYNTIIHKLFNGIPSTKEEDEFITRVNNSPHIKHSDFSQNVIKQIKTKCTYGHCF